jgi:hypothetical protein
MNKKKVQPFDANAELYTRLIKDEYIEYLTLELVLLTKGKLTKRNITSVENRLLKDFYEALDTTGILARVRQKAKLV